jgi:periplasmic divalent cation tolerance protein
MSRITDPILILWTCKDQKEAKKIILVLLERKLIACASIIPHVESFFQWQGKIEQAKECKVFLKTARKKFIAVRDYILAHASYEVPEILQLPIEQGNPTYLKWMQSEIK